MSPETYDLDQSRRSLEELYAVLLDAHGNIIDGNSRLQAYPGWRTERRENIKTRTQLWLARIIANNHRRIVSREERIQQFTELAKSLVEDEAVTRENVVSTISKLTTFTERYVRELLPNEYKRSYSPPDNSELSSEYEDLAKGELSRTLHGLGVTVPTGPVSMGTPEPHKKQLPQLQEAPATPPPQDTRSPKERALEYIRGYYERDPKPDVEYLSWEAAILCGVTEKEALDLIDQFIEERSPVTESRRDATHRHNEDGAVTCPLCSRGGASRGVILSRVKDPNVAQLTLEKFIMEAMKSG
jgi:hypothetical protein